MTAHHVQHDAHLFPVNPILRARVSANVVEVLHVLQVKLLGREGTRIAVAAIDRTTIRASSPEAAPHIQRLRPFRVNVLVMFNPPGWSRHGWGRRLRGLAEACESIHSKTASAYRQIAAAVETVDSAMRPTK